MNAAINSSVFRTKSLFLRTNVLSSTSRDFSSVPLKMRAAMISNHGEILAVQQTDVPKPKAGEVLVRINRSGCCHSDVHAIDGDWPVLSRLPLCPGHEGAGVVVALGANVARPKLGDRVGIAWLHSACGFCEFCLSGHETLCIRQKNSGYSVNGTLAEYAIATASHAIPLPDGVTDDQAAPLLCAGVTSYKALKETGAKAGDFVTIMGAGGGLGHLAIQYAKAMGMQVIAMDKGLEKLNFCKSLGADFAIDVTDSDAVAQVIKASSGGSQAVTCFAPNLIAFKMCIDVARRNGIVVAVGLPSGSFPCSVFDIVLKGITIKGSIVGTRNDMVEAMSFASRGLVKCSVELDDLENIADIFTRLRKGTILGRVVIKLN